MNYPWAAALLSDLRLKPTNLRLTSLALWAESESMPEWTINPLGAHFALRQSVAVDQTGRQQYQSFNDFLLSVTCELQKPGNRMIAAGLGVARDYVQMWSAINASSWAPGAQSGTYPAQLCIEAFGRFVSRAELVEIAKSASSAAQIASSGDFARAAREMGNVLPDRINGTRIAADSIIRVLPG